MKKYVLPALAVIISIVLLPAAISAAAPVSVKTNGAAAEFGSQTQPYINNSGDTMVPLSYLDSLGIWTAWNDQTQTVTLINGKTVSGTNAGTIVDNSASGNNLNLTVSGNVPFVKLRSVSNIFVLTLSWDSGTKTVNVSSALKKPDASNKSLILATTTSTQDSGLLDYLLPLFEKDTGITVKAISVGTGAAIKMGSDGEADVMLVHAKNLELGAMKAGDAISRHELMYNDFIIVGPADDPAGVKAACNKTLDALKAIYKAGSAFISRGDKSGTDTLEKSLWKAAGITPDPKHYLEAATGMLATLTIAEQKNGYTITDRATYLKNKDKLSLAVLCEGDGALLNQYSVMVVNPNKNDKINVLAAMQFSDWLISDKGQRIINEYGVADYGHPLFYANYKPEY